MKKEFWRFLRHSGIELLVYAVLVSVYFFLALHFLGNWLHHLYTDNRKLYALIALALIVGQGAFLEILTTALLRLIGSGKRD